MKMQITIRVSLAAFIAWLPVAFATNAEYRLHIEPSSGIPVITWSNNVGEAAQLVAASMSGAYTPTTETPYMGTGTVYQWSPTRFDDSMPILMTINLGYRFRIVSISNDTTTGAAVIQWASRSGAVYRVLRTADPRDWSASSIASNIVAFSPYNSYHDPTAGLGPQYYAVEQATSNGWLRSDNAAGFYTMDIQSTVGDAIYQLGNPFAPLDGSPFDFHSLIGIQGPLPVGTRAYLWTDDLSLTTYAGSHWVTSTLTASGWEPDSEPVLRGEGYFLRRSNGTTPGILSFRGELPSATYAATSCIPIINIGSGQQLNHALGYPYPFDIKLTNITLWKETTNAIFSKYNTSNMTYDFWIKGIHTNLSGIVLRRGEGFFIRPSAGSGDHIWKEVKPYSWP